MATISLKAIKLLWSNSAGICSFSGCNQKLSVERSEFQKSSVLGEMAHIRGEKAGSNRYDENQNAEQRNSYENLILLCPTHHTLIDKKENEDSYSVELLHEMKKRHELSISSRVSEVCLENVDKLKDFIAIYLSENKLVWEHYGPNSLNAKLNPHSQQIFNEWETAKLTTIVPNNRLLVNTLQNYRHYFKRKDQNTISEFVTHVESYEKWVSDKIPYKAVLRFPERFELLIFEE